MTLTARLARRQFIASSVLTAAGLATRSGAESPEHGWQAYLHAATLSEPADLIDYLVKRIGIDHVGIGGDVNGIESTALGTSDRNSPPNSG